MTTPRPPHPDDLERQIAALTAYRSDRGATAPLWERALDRADSAPPRRPWFHRLGVGTPANALLAASVVLVCLVGFGAIVLRPLGSVRGPAPTATATAERWKATTDGSLAAGAEGRRADGPPPASRGLAEPAVSPSAPSERYVVRKSNIDIRTDDVRAAFAKAAHLVSAARGEFVENTSFTGEGPTARANLTLRVAADRLGAVLAELRELGTVKSESSSGEDVTGQVVDLEARIRNEQRIESELLQLLEQRGDAPLKDILELRSSLSSVRESIERLIGQRDRLGRLVSLSSVLVVIRADDEKRGAATVSITEYFTARVAATWSAGLRFLADTLAGVVGLLVGGLLWWLLAACLIYAIVRYRRRLSARCV